jgi:hypothetical protein
VKPAVAVRCPAPDGSNRPRQATARYQARIPGPAAGSCRKMISYVLAFASAAANAAGNVLNREASRDEPEKGGFASG